MIITIYQSESNGLNKNQKKGMWRIIKKKKKILDLEKILLSALWSK